MKKLNINRQLLPVKGFYFLWNAGTGPVVPFLSTYARQLGFSSVTVGLIYTILPIFGMFAKLLFGSIADKFKCRKPLFLIGQLLTAVALLAILYSPKFNEESRVQIFCDQSGTTTETDDGELFNCNLNCLMHVNYWESICNNNNNNSEHCNGNIRINFTTNISTVHIDLDILAVHYNLIDDSNRYPICFCDNTTINNNNECISPIECNIKCNDYDIRNIVTPNIKDEDVSGMYQFWVFLLLMTLAWIGQALAVSIGDSICFEMLGDEPHKYGYQRMFGALGWGIFSTIAGLMVDALSDGQIKNYTSAFYLGFAFLLVSFIVSWQIKYTQPNRSQNLFRNIGQLLLDIRIIVFLLWCVSVGMCTGLMWNFLFWLIEDRAALHNAQDWVKTLQGLVMAVQCLLGELPFFFLSGSILKKIGHINSMTLVLLVFGVRCILYSVISNPWWFIPIEVSNGLTFGLFYACMASYASIVAPPEAGATMQGLVGAIFEGVGVALGSSVAGILYNKYGGVWTFRLFGIGATIIGCVHALAQLIIKRFYKNEGLYKQ